MLKRSVEESREKHAAVRSEVQYSELYSAVKYSELYSDPGNVCDV